MQGEPAPDSTTASSLDHATSTIDDLTLALTSFSRVPSPEPQRQICCCCGNEDCEATKNWIALKSRLESRLILSAEVGSALLQRHEAYVRRHEPSGTTPRKASQDSAHEDASRDRAEGDARLVGLLKENVVLQKRLTRALLNNELAEASSKTVLHELEEARGAVSRLTAHHARSVGLDTRLSAVLQENDDIRQERDSQTQRAKLAEARLAALKDQKLQAEVCRLQEDLEIRRLQRFESSESLLQDVRSRLEGLQNSHFGKSAMEENVEVTKVLESLVADNEILKADNEELHKLLTESREDLQALQREVGEHSIFVPPIQVETFYKHSRTSSGPSSLVRDSLLSSTRRPSSVEPRFRRIYEPLTPETSRRPLSPADSLLASATKYTNFIHPQPRYPLSHLSFGTDTEPEYDQGLLLENQATKGVQTDRWLGAHPSPHLAPSFVDQLFPSPHDGHSDSSSLLDGHGSPISSLLERMHTLLHRMTQADALTLTNRLKRQHLRGADVKHLSRTTISNILSEVSHLRAHYRMWLEDEKMTTLCTRKDLRGLFKLFREVLEEMGQMRVTLNDVILEPSIAIKVSEMALDSAKAEAMERERKSGSVLGPSWMAPFSKLFGSSLHDPGSQSSTRATARPPSRGHGVTRTPRPVPKIAPALAASTTTVNVEFSGTGTGKSVTSIFSAHPSNEGAQDHFPRINTLPQPIKPTQPNVRSVMGIFAGAPHVEDALDPWVILPRAPRRVQSAFFKADPAENGTATTCRSAVRKRHASQLSRGVDAVLDADTVSIRNVEDSEAGDVPGPLLERTLRRRGLSDSSIHSTLMNQGGGSGDTANANSAEPTGAWLERTSVLRTLSRTMQNFKQAASHTISGVANPTAATALSSSLHPASAPGTSDSKGSASGDSLDIHHSQQPRGSSAAFSLFLPGLTSWAAGGAPDSSHTYSPLQVNVHGSVREDATIPRLLGRESQGRGI
ncbi:hypothetical protein PAXRUDRAFT_143685 [Paxillus rubicundulus Ve08.2h10]|uniref:Uncharacterized protein n=1 Tax=Paxillus rubicundulus Ve08.2h10 TaxID=930991 RepID=A0A0D0E1D5_9AGAM|nr:hypothetical protein PAXRUDRAFT_143685 [Paxillus rubicundulus Ve08.2h10]